MTFAWRPGSQCDVAATRGAGSVLASDCRAHFGRPSTRKGCRICVTVRLPVRPRGETMYWQANANTPLSVTPPFNVPYVERSKTRGFPKGGVSHFFSGEVLIVSRTLSGLFLVGAVTRPKKRKRANQENPRRVPGQIGKFRKNRESPEKDKKEGQVQIGQIGKPPRLKPRKIGAFRNRKFQIAMLFAFKTARTARR